MSEGEAPAAAPQPDHDEQQHDDSTDTPRLKFENAVKAIVEWARRRSRP